MLNKGRNEMKTIYSVWVGGGGGEVNDCYLTHKQAKEVAKEYNDKGYNDVIIEKVGILMKELGIRNYLMIRSAVKDLGTYDPDQIFPYFEEELYMNQTQEIYKFLKWVHENKKVFGSGNYEQCFKEFKREVAK